MSNLVFVRVRPLKAQGEQACLSTSSDTKGVVLQGSNGIKSPENFKFDGVFGMTATQEDVFQVSSSISTFLLFHAAHMDSFDYFLNRESKISFTPCWRRATMALSWRMGKHLQGKLMQCLVEVA